MILVCANCEGGTALAEAVEATGAPVRLVGCMNACGSAPVMAVRDPGREAYLFGPVPVAAAADVPVFLELYRDAPGGRIAEATAIPVLRHCLIGRIPAA
ncbi:DUF1636 family protein [Pseudooceanicola onchidii]|uniref:DUF1636 family protein n=1 Tax=Pseudooceanicola onchidii TaxID=2562279 RepID=UPI00145B91F7|nr:DUF1636 family protein [Pseudooceanicola onchidii]